MRLVLLLISFSFLTNASAQTASITQEDIDIINIAIKDTRAPIKLLSSIHDYWLKEIKNLIKKRRFIKRMEDENHKDVSDTIKLSNSDIKLIGKKLRQLRKFQWTVENFSKINLRNLTIISQETSRSDSMQYSIKYRIIPPIYFKNHTYCIFSYDYACGGLCGHGTVVVYKKTANGWKKWDHLTMWYD